MALLDSKRLNVFAGLLVGIVLIAVFIITAQSPTRLTPERTVTEVQVIEVRSLPFRIEARGQGVARPSQSWQAIANVEGEIVERHPDLEDGAMLVEGTRLLVVDPSRYKLAIADARADLQGLQTELDKLDAEEANISRLLELEKERLDLSEHELSRIETLFLSGTVARATVDEQKRFTLSLRQAVVSLENSLAMLPIRRETARAQYERSSVRLAQAQRDLEDTVFVAPYDLRVGPVNVELHQFVSRGKNLFEVDNLAAVEVEARIPFSMMRRLLGHAATPTGNSQRIQERIDFSLLDAEIELVGAEDVRWQGKVIHVANGLEPKTRSVRVVVRVDAPYQEIHPLERPPLQRDAYTKVRISKMSNKPLLAIPASSVVQGKVMVVGKDNQLEHRSVEVAFEQRDLIVIREGLSPGELVIVDKISPAIEGMLLAPLRDHSLEEYVTAQAIGIRP